MAEHILSCGCKSRYFGIQAEWDKTDRDGNPAVAFGVICEKHLHELGARRPWSGLTDEEIDNLDLPPSGTATVRDFIRLIEAKLREKNVGLS